MKILVVDDSAVMRRLIARNLTEAVPGVEVAEAGDGQEALAAIEGETYTLVITDWNMPNMSGIEFIRAMKATPHGQSMPVLVLSTEGTPDKIEAAMEAGAIGYLTKPFTTEKLQNKLIEALSS